MRKITHLYAAPGGARLSQQDVLCERVACSSIEAAGGRVDGRAGNVWFFLQSPWKKSMQAELMSFGIDLFDLEDEVQGAAKGLSRAGISSEGYFF